MDSVRTEVSAEILQVSRRQQPGTVAELCIIDKAKLCFIEAEPKSYMFDWHIATLCSLRKYIAKCLAELHVQAGVTLARSAADFPDEVGERCVMTVSVPAAIAAGSATAESWE